VPSPTNLYLNSRGTTIVTLIYIFNSNVVCKLIQFLFFIHSLSDWRDTKCLRQLLYQIQEVLLWLRVVQAQIWTTSAVNVKQLGKRKYFFIASEIYGNQSKF